MISLFTRNAISFRGALLITALACSVLTTPAVGQSIAELASSENLPNFHVTMPEGPTAPVVHVLDAAANEVATIQFNFGKAGFSEAHYVGNVEATGLSVFFQQSLGMLEITLPRGQVVSWTFDRTTRQWLRLKGTDEEVSILGLDPFREALAQVAAAGDAAIKAVPSPTVFNQDPGGGDGGGGGIGCYGSQVTGWGYSFRRSSSCSSATQHANNQCNNSLCWGCCATSSCDCLCAPAPGNQGFFCGCLVTGTSCGN